MCTMSMVYDHFSERFPKDWPGIGGGSGLGPIQPVDTPKFTWPLPPSVDLAELRKLIDEFKQAIEAARTLDLLMQQKDCVDPTKAALQERVDRMEKIIDALLPKASIP